MSSHLPAVKHRISVVKGDITKVEVDAIFNAANSSLMGGGGVDGAIHRAGGPQILEECRKIIARQGSCKTGEAVITSAGNLPARYVIHTVGPVWNGGKSGEKELLSSCYQHCLKLAEEHQCGTVSFPNISTGVYRFPKELAAGIAMKSIAGYLGPSASSLQVVLVCFDDENFSLCQQEWEAL